MQTTHIAAWSVLASMTAIFLAAGMTGAHTTQEQATSTIVMRPLAPVAPCNPTSGPACVPAFIPATVTCAADGHCTFVNADTVIPHHPHDDDGDCFDTKPMSSGTVATVDISACGASGDSITYHCHIHPGMVGTLVIA